AATPRVRAIRARHAGDTETANAETWWTRPVDRRFRSSQVQIDSDWCRSASGEAPSSGGWGREGVRSEARAEQRLAPGGRAALPLTRTKHWRAALPLTRGRTFRPQ